MRTERETTPTFDNDGYPTGDTLARIEDWPYVDIAGCLDFVQAAWSDYGSVAHEVSAHEAGVLRANPTDKYLRLATGGWSGNEELIAALRTNTLIHQLAWRLSARGGLHIYEYPERPA